MTVQCDSKTSESVPVRHCSFINHFKPVLPLVIRCPTYVAVTWLIMGKDDVINKTGSTKRIASMPDVDRDTASVNMQQKFGDV